MGLTELNFSFEAMRWIVITAIGIYAWVIDRQSASAKELLDLRTRITTLEAMMNQVPSQAQLHELVASVASLREALRPLLPALSPSRAVWTASKTTC